VTGRAENSVRISGSAQSSIRNVVLENVSVTMGRWTKYKGGLWDNRPTKTQADIELHGNPGYSIRHADGVKLEKCSVNWEAAPPEYFTSALEADHVTGLEMTACRGTAAHGPDIVVR